MADTKVSSMTEDTAPTVDDLLYEVNSPGGTPADRKLQLGTLLGTLMKNYLTGLTLSNNATDATNDIDIAAGLATDSTNAYLLVLSSALTKRLDAAWAVGTNQGGLDTGAIANTTYHVWLIRRPDTGVVDALFSTSASAPTMPTNYTQKRRIGSIVRASAAIKTFVQDGDIFTWKVPTADVSATNPGTAAVTRTLTVPTGIRVEAKVGVYAQGLDAASSPSSVYLSDLSVTDTVASASVQSIVVYTTAAIVLGGGATAKIYTNTSGQIRSRVQTSTANTSINISTIGWRDTRGRDG